MAQNNNRKNKKDLLNYKESQEKLKNQILTKKRTDEINQNLNSLRDMFLYNKNHIVPLLNKDGKDKSYDFINEILEQRINLFSYKKNSWPFKFQTPQELEKYLYFYGAVAYTEYQDSYIFFPVFFSKNNNNFGVYNFNNFNFQSSYLNQSIINKLTISNIDIIAVKCPEWNSDIVINKFNENKEWKNKLPFIFDNFLQIAPFIKQNQLIKDLSNVYNALNSNRLTKLKSYEIEYNQGNQLNTAINSLLALNDYSPFHIKEKIKQTTEIKPDKAFNKEAIDVFENLNIERKELENTLLKFNGLSSSISLNKKSAQETDSQINHNQRETANILNNLLKCRKYWINNLNKNIKGSNLYIDLTDAYNKWIQKILFDKNDIIEKVEKLKATQQVAEPGEEAKAKQS